MQQKKVQCPTCGVTLMVQNRGDEPAKQITCPQCQTELLVKFPPKQAPIEAKTVYAPPRRPADSGETQLATPKAQNNSLAQVARLMGDSEYYTLCEGRNIIGRRAKTSTATIQIATTDHYMSRQHCCITVTTLPDGSLKAVLSNFHNKNLLAVEGQEVEKGDEIRLMDGNTITMGNTTVTFKIK